MESYFNYLPRTVSPPFPFPCIPEFLSYLYSCLCEVYSLCKVLSCEHVRVVSLLKHLFQLLQLEAGEGGAISAFLLVTWSGHITRAGY